MKLGAVRINYTMFSVFCPLSDEGRGKEANVEEGFISYPTH